MPQADMYSNNSCTDSQPEPSQDIPVQPDLHVKKKDAGQGGVGATGDSQGSLSSVLDDLIPATAMAAQPSSSPADVSLTLSGQANSSRGSPGTLQQMPSSSDMMQLTISLLDGIQEDNLQQQPSPQQQQPAMCRPVEQGSAMTLATMEAPEPTLSVDRPVRVVLDIAKEANQAEETLKVTLHVRPSACKVVNLHAVWLVCCGLHNKLLSYSHSHCQSFDWASILQCHQRAIRNVECRIARFFTCRGMWSGGSQNGCCVSTGG